jgi:hypothetical protein
LTGVELKSGRISFEVVNGETEHVTVSGRRVRRPTVLIRVGRWNLSKRAALLGAALALLQVLDGVLTYFGLYLMGIQMEGNVFLRDLMLAYGKAPVLVVAKFGAILCVFILTLSAHRRRWMRPVIGLFIAVYLILAVIPWIAIIAGQRGATSAPLGLVSSINR